MHDRVIAARDTLHAHADIDVLSAELFVEYADGFKHVSRMQNVVHGTEELANLSQLIEMVEGVLENVYELERRSRIALEP